MPRSRSTAIQSERTRRRSPRAFTSPANWIAPPNTGNFSVGLFGVRKRKWSQKRSAVAGNCFHCPEWRVRLHRRHEGVFLTFLAGKHLQLWVFFRIALRGPRARR